MSATDFAYRAVDGDGAVVEGRLRARDEHDALDRIRTLGFTPTKVDPLRVSLLQRDLELGLVQKRVAPTEMAASIRQLAAMVRAGVPILTALSVAVDQSASEVLVDAWRDVRRDVESGDGLSLAMERQDHVFDAVTISLVRAGEASGALDEVLAQAATALERKAEVRRKVRSALAYPVAVVVLVGVVLMAMSIMVVPVFRDVYADLGGDLPWVTAVVLGFTGILGRFAPLWVVATFATVVGVRRWKRTDDGAKRWDRWVLRLPLMGDLVRKSILARSARTLAVLTSAGVSLLDALSIAAAVANNAVMSDVLDRCGQAVRRGEHLSSVLVADDDIPPLFAQVVSVGEESGDIAEMLTTAAEVYEAEVDATADGFSSVVEPLLVAGLGLVVGGLVLALYLPMFRLVDLVQ